MAAPKLQVTGINHVVLHVTDMERSRSFYMDILGFEDRNISGGPPNMKASFLQCGMQGLDLFEVPGDAHGGQEMNHMALNVTADDLDQLVSLLSEAGVDASERTTTQLGVHIRPRRPPPRDVASHRQRAGPRAPRDRCHRVAASNGLV